MKVLFLHAPTTQLGSLKAWVTVTILKQSVRTQPLLLNHEGD